MDPTDLCSHPSVDSLTASEIRVVFNLQEYEFEAAAWLCHQYEGRAQSCSSRPAADSGQHHKDGVWSAL